jgi:hypothetical protein
MKPILSEWKHCSQEEMIPNEFNMTQMAQHPPIRSTSIPTKIIIYGMFNVGMKLIAVCRVRL